MKIFYQVKQVNWIFSASGAYFFTCELYNHLKWYCYMFRGSPIKFLRSPFSLWKWLSNFVLYNTVVQHLVIAHNTSFLSDKRIQDAFSLYPSLIICHVIFLLFFSMPCCIQHHFRMLKFTRVLRYNFIQKNWLYVENNQGIVRHPSYNWGTVFQVS